MEARPHYPNKANASEPIVSGRTRSDGGPSLEHLITFEAIHLVAFPTGQPCNNNGLGGFGGSEAFSRTKLHGHHFLLATFSSPIWP